MNNTVTDTSRFGPEVSKIMADHVWNHNAGKHKIRPRTGCPGCLLASAGTREGETDGVTE